MAVAGAPEWALAVVAPAQAAAARVGVPPVALVAEQVQAEAPVLDLARELAVPAPVVVAAQE